MTMNRAALILWLNYAKVKEYTFLSCEQYIRKHRQGKLPKKFLVFRMDVDFDLPKSRQLIVALAALQATGTVFFRVHSEKYQIEDAVSAIKIAQLYGLEVGLHCEPLSVAHITGEDPEKVLRRDLEKFEAITGVAPVGVASHGQNDIPVNNLDFWQHRSPEKFGLLYEAYCDEMFRECRYISDSPESKWKSYDDGVLMQGDYQSLFMQLEDAVPNIYMLVHPCVWDKTMRRKK